MGLGSSSPTGGRAGATLVPHRRDKGWPRPVVQVRLLFTHPPIPSIRLPCHLPELADRDQVLGSYPAVSRDVHLRESTETASECIRTRSKRDMDSRSSSLAMGLGPERTQSLSPTATDSFFDGHGSALVTSGVVAGG